MRILESEITRTAFVRLLMDRGRHVVMVQNGLGESREIVAESKLEAEEEFDFQVGVTS